MKKLERFVHFVFLVAFMIAPSIAKAEIPGDVYLKGTQNGWASDQKYKFQPTSDPDVVYLHIDQLDGEFKIADDDWSVINYGGSGYLGETMEVTTGTYRAVYRAKNFNSSGLKNVTFIFDFHHQYAPSLIVVPTESFKQSDYEFPVDVIEEYDVEEEPGMERSGIYLMSEMSDSRWQAKPHFEFHHKPGSDIHTLKVPTLYHGFKFASSDYKDVDLGHVGEGGWLRIDELGTYHLQKGGDAFYTPPMIDVVFTLDLTDKADPKFTIAKDPEPDTSWKEGMHLTYAEEFNGNSLNTDRWVPYEGNADWQGALNIFTGREKNVEVKDGALNLIARREEYNGMHITSGGVRSYGGMVYRYGRLDIRMKQPPTNNGLCVALWILGYHYSWPSCGEIDILEQGHGIDIEQGNTPYLSIEGTFGGPFSELLLRVTDGGQASLIQCRTTIIISIHYSGIRIGY